MKKIFLIILLFGLGSFIGLESCTKTNYFDGYVIQNGDPNDPNDPNAECIWLLNIDGTVFMVAGLKEECKVDGKKITIQYTVSAAPYVCNSKSYAVASITKYL